MKAVFLAGYIVSAGFGERTGPAVHVVLDGSWVRVQTGLEIVPKIESGSGWLGKVDLDVGRTAFLGLGYTHRDARTWTKEAAWARVGVQMANGALRLTARHDFSTRNSVSIVEVECRASRGRVELRSVVGAGGFLDGVGQRRYGTVAEVSVGLALSGSGQRVGRGR